MISWVSVFFFSYDPLSWQPYAEVRSGLHAKYCSLAAVHIACRSICMRMRVQFCIKILLCFSLFIVSLPFKKFNDFKAQMLKVDLFLLYWPNTWKSKPERWSMKILYHITRLFRLKVNAQISGMYLPLMLRKLGRRVHLAYK